MHGRDWQRISKEFYGRKLQHVCSYQAKKIYNQMAEKLVEQDQDFMKQFIGHWTPAEMVVFIALLKRHGRDLQAVAEKMGKKLHQC